MTIFCNKCVALSLLLPLILCAACGGGSSESTDKAADSITSVLPSHLPEVKTVVIQPKMFTHDIVSNGKVSAHDFADLRFAASDAVIDRIYVKNGDHVSKGQPIASLDRFKLENQLAQNQATIDKARIDLADVLIGQGYDPEKPETVPADVMKLARLRSGLDQAEAVINSTRRDLEMTTLTAPFDGVVANLFQKVHNRPDQSEPFCRIVASGQKDVEFTVLESELSVIRKGDAVNVSAFASQDSYQGQLTEINPVVDKDGLVKVRASVNDGGKLFDGMNVKVSVHRALDEQLVVPKSAVVLRSGKPVVFTTDGKKALWNYVQTGLENMSEYVITDGLEAGAVVIYDGNVNLAHEAPVLVVGGEK